MLEPQIFHQIALAGVVMAATFLLHAIFIALGSVALRSARGKTAGFQRFLQDIFWLVALSVWLLFAHGLAIGMWAWIYQWLAVVPDWETALYFAGSTYTSLGYGDVLANNDWRLMTGATATNGLLLFGLSTAILVDASARLRLGD